jgi:hypothetical protein
MASQTKVAFFAACFAVFVMVVASSSGPFKLRFLPQHDAVSQTFAMDMTPGMYMGTPAPAPSGSPSSLTHSSMVTGLLAFTVTFLVVRKGV